MLRSRVENACSFCLYDQLDALCCGLYRPTRVDALCPNLHRRFVGVHDGDTITVYDGREQTRIRLDGIDCPETGADFSTRAKQLTPDLAFGKQVQIRGKETDRYGCLVARVIVDGTEVSLALVEARLAWHYKQYSNDQVLAAAEIVAKAKKIGVWSLPNPVPPWAYRAGTVISSGPYHGNARSKVYHAAGCQHYDCKNCTVQLASADEAKHLGFRPHESCTGHKSETAVPASSSAVSTSTSSVTYHGSRNSKVYHAPGCRYYTCKNCTVMLKSKEEAAQKGFRPHSGRGGCVQ